jgi:hypothetical protein
MIAATPWDINPSAAVVAAAESTQVESALIGLIVSPPSKEPESEASLKANSADAAIAGVRDSIGPVNPKIIPILISANVLVVKIDKDIIAAINSFFIFSLLIILLICRVFTVRLYFSMGNFLLFM